MPEKQGFSLELQPGPIAEKIAADITRSLQTPGRGLNTFGEVVVLWESLRLGPSKRVAEYYHNNREAVDAALSVDGVTVVDADEDKVLVTNRETDRKKLEIIANAVAAVSNKIPDRGSRQHASVTFPAESGSFPLFVYTSVTKVAQTKGWGSVRIDQANGQTPSEKKEFTIHLMK